MAVTESTTLLERVPFLGVLSTADRAVLARSVARRRYRRGDVIFEKDDPGNSVFIIERGSVRIYLPSAQGADLTLAMLGPGHFFGDLSLLDGRPRSASAAASAETMAITLERADFLALLRARPDAAASVLAVVAHRLRDANEMASDLAFLDVPGRLAKKLLELGTAHGLPRADGVFLNTAITQEELANMIGVTRETVNRNLSLFRRLGLIKMDGRRFVLRDPEALRSRCE